MHDLDALILEQLLVVGVDLGVRGAVVRGCLDGALLDDVAERDHLHLGDLAQRGHVLVVGDAAAADDADANLSHVKTSSF